MGNGQEEHCVTSSFFNSSLKSHASSLNGYTSRPTCTPLTSKGIQAGQKAPKQLKGHTSRLKGISAVSKGTSAASKGIQAASKGTATISEGTQAASQGKQAVLTSTCSVRTMQSLVASFRREFSAFSSWVVQSRLCLFLASS